MLSNCIMARRLSGRQVLDQIFANEKIVKIVKSSNDANSSSGSHFQVESNDCDADVANDDGGLADEQTEIEETNVESTSDSDDYDVLYSIAESTPVSQQLRWINWVVMRGVLVIASFLKIQRRDGYPLHQQVRIENIIKGQPGPTSYAKQGVSRLSG